MTKRYNPRWSGQRIIHEGPRRSWVYRIGYAAGYRWMSQPTWARTMVYFAIGYFIGSNWDAWLS